MTDITITEKNVGILTVGTWPQWSRKCKAILRANAMWTYIEGEKSTPPSDTAKQPVWVETNDRIVGILCHVVEDSLAQEIEDFKSASGAWMHLKRKTYQNGANSKFHALQNAMRLRFTNPTSISPVLTELKDCLDAIYCDKAPTRDEWTVGILLHAMNDTDFDGLRDILMASTTALTPIDIIQCMESKVQERRHRDAIKNDDAILAAKQKSHKPVRCSNCDRNGHTIEKCWEKGGGSEGKAPDWWKSLKERQRQGTKGKSKERAHATITEVTDDDSGSETCGVLQDLPLTKFQCSIDWSNLIASAEQSPPYFLDSGATSHCSPDLNDFSDYRHISPRTIRGINGTSISATAIGTIKIRCGKGRCIVLHDALYIPDAKLRLISIGRLGDMGVTATFTASMCSIMRGSRMIAQGTRAGTGLYHLDGVIKTEKLLLARTAPDLDTWHKQLGHVNYESIIRMAEQGLASGMPTNLSTIPPICEHCILGKQTRTPVPKVREGGRAKWILEKVFSDITGPEDVQTPHGGLYTLNFIDDFSQKTWVYVLKHKDDAITHFKEWKALVEWETDLTVKIFRTDNGGEYTSREFEKYLKERGIAHQTTAPYSSAQNGKAERLHRTLFNRARAIMSQTKLPPKLWGECIQTAAYLKDRTPTRTLKDMTPYEAYYGSKPDVSHLREIGCKAFILTQSERRRKIYDRSVEGILVGYSQTSKAYRCYYPTTGRIIVSRHVSFIESKDTKPRPYRPGVSVGSDMAHDCDARTSPNSYKHLADEDIELEEKHDTEDDTSDETSEIPPSETDGDTVRRSTRPKKPSVAAAQMRGLPYESNLEQTIREMRERSARHSGPNQMLVLTDTKRNEDVNTFFGVADDDPRTYKQAMEAYDADYWNDGYDQEIDSMHRHGVWTLVPRSSVPKDRRIVGSRPVFFRKRDENNNVSRRKVRVVAKGYSQVEGVDFTDTFAPVSRLESVRAVLALVASQDWEIHQFDVKTAFLHGELTEEIYMEQPDG